MIIPGFLVSAYTWNLARPSLEIFLYRLEKWLLLFLANHCIQRSRYYLLQLHASLKLSQKFKLKIRCGLYLFPGPWFANPWTIAGLKLNSYRNEYYISEIKWLVGKLMPYSSCIILWFSLIIYTVHPVQPWASYVASLCLGFLTCKMQLLCIATHLRITR